MFKTYLYFITFCIILLRIVYLLSSISDLYKTRRKKWLFCYGLLGSLIIGINYIESLYPLNYQIGSEHSHCTYYSSQSLPKTGTDLYQIKLRLSGFDTCWEYTASRDTITEIEYGLSVYKGKAKLVLVSPFGQVTMLAENKTQDSDESLKKIQVALKPGKNKIKLVTSHQTHVLLQLKVSEGSILPLDD